MKTLCDSRHMVEAMVKHAVKIPAHKHYALLFVTAYAFLLRVPSEALPMIVWMPHNVPEGQSVVYMDGNTINLKLRRRKNRPKGSLLTRHCTCKVLVVDISFSAPAVHV